MMDAAAFERTASGLIVPKKQFLLPSGLGGERRVGVLTPEINVSRRTILKVGGLTAVGFGLHGALAPNRAEAAWLGVLAKAMLGFVGAAFTGVVSNWLCDGIKRSRWESNDWSRIRDPHHRFHVEHAAEKKMVEPVQARQDDYGRWFEIDGFGRTDLTNPVESTFDMNAPEYARLAGEFDCFSAPYRPVSMRRRLTADDHDLFCRTIRVYADASYIPTPTGLTPEYAREVCDSQGNAYTGFGTAVVSNGRRSRNFLIGETSSYG
jgi:hypothetical protein